MNLTTLSYELKSQHDHGNTFFPFIALNSTEMGKIVTKFRFPLVIFQADLKKLAANLESLECLMRAPFPDDDDDEAVHDEDKVEIENERSSELDPVSILVTAPSYESLDVARIIGSKGDFTFSTLSPGEYKPSPHLIEVKVISDLMRRLRTTLKQ